MKVHLTPPPISSYNSLPAHLQLPNQRLGKHIRRLGRIFLRHPDSHRYALCLLHRHYDLRSGEIIVQYPTNGGVVSIAEPHLAPHQWSMLGVIPVAWHLGIGQEEEEEEEEEGNVGKIEGLVPYEFQFGRGKIKDLDMGFLQELGEFLERKRLGGLFGVCLAEEHTENTDIEIERMEGRGRRIVIEKSSQPVANGVPVKWKFYEGRDTSMIIRCIRMCV
ncbi:uncharacterized protein VTP21DRAFT_4192 [Calcarisporiella thermophila]|uniref:uncharacterized protein n=1 Tax=Calcarisporiella thermophila TaxID=911321 RepID=UPI003743CF9B